MIPTRDRLLRVLIESYDLTPAEAQQFLSTLAPVLDIGRIPLEDQFPQIRLGVAGGRVAAAAALLAKIQLRNPVGSNVLVVIESILARIDSNGHAHGFSTTLLADNVGTITRMMRDRRGGDAGLVATAAGSNADAGTTIITVAETFEQTVSEMRWFPVDVVLPAGVFYNFEALAVNAPIRAHFKWYEFDLRVR